MEVERVTRVLVPRPTVTVTADVSARRRRYPQLLRQYHYGNVAVSCTAVPDVTQPVLSCRLLRNC